MSTRLQPPRGTQDVLPDDWRLRHAVMSAARWHLSAAGFGRISTPTFEDTALFARGVGEHTDVVSKEMYTFEDRSGRSITLRPEGTAPVVRSYITHGMHKWPQPVRLWYAAPMFRYEAPQKGRLREHTQIGAEIFGASGPAADAEVIALLHSMYDDLGIPGCRLRLNTIGDATTRPAYRALLTEYLRERAADFSDEARRRLAENPLRLFDSKEEAVQAALTGAPKIREHVSAECAEHFAEVQALLEAAGIAYEVDDSLVRGFDYYTHTTFEFTSSALGAQDAIGGGGRYDGLVQMLGGPATPAVGFGSGIERIMLALRETGAGAAEPAPGVYLVAETPSGRRRAFATLVELRQDGIFARMDVGERSRNGQFKAAGRSGARVAVVCDGERAEIHQLADRTTEEVDWTRLVERIEDTVEGETEWRIART